MRNLLFLLLAPLIYVANTWAADKPNILIIWGDDIGQFNVSAYNHGMMGYKTPNIDRIANEGILFTDAYGDQSCTAGRSGFITGQHPIRTGLTKVGLPGAPEGIDKQDPTIASTKSSLPEVKSLHTTLETPLANFVIDWSPSLMKGLWRNIKTD